MKINIDVNEIIKNLNDDEAFILIKKIDQYIEDMDLTERIFEYCLDDMINVGYYDDEKTPKLIRKMLTYIKKMEKQRKLEEEEEE